MISRALAKTCYLVSKTSPPRLINLQIPSPAYLREKADELSLGSAPAPAWDNSAKSFAGPGILPQLPKDLIGSGPNTLSHKKALYYSESINQEISSLAQLELEKTRHIVAGPSTGPNPRKLG